MLPYQHLTVVTDANLIGKFRTLFVGKLLGIERYEYVAVAWSFGCFFCILSSYYILRPVRDAFAVGSGPDTIPYLFLGTFIAMLIATPIFGWIASRFPRRVFLPWVYSFFVLNILIFWAIFSQNSENPQESVWLGRAFFVWMGVFNLYIVSVFWSFMADIYTREQGRRLFGVISAGGSIGALLGGIATSLVVVDIGSHNLLPVAACLLFIAMLCIRRLRTWVASEHQDTVADTVESEKPLGGTAFSGVTHVFSSKYFSGIAVASIIASLLGTALYMFTARLLEEAVPDLDEQTRFFSNVNIAANTFSLIGQMLLVGRLVGRFGIGVSLSLMPLVSVLGFFLLAVNPVLGVVAFLTAARRALGFAFSKPTTDMLYSVATPEEKYKTKNFIDTAVYRVGDLLGAWALQPLLWLGITWVSLLMLPFAIVWAAVSLWLGRDYRRQAKQLKESGVS